MTGGEGREREGSEETYIQGKSFTKLAGVGKAEGKDRARVASLCLQKRAIDASCNYLAFSASGKHLRDLIAMRLFFFEMRLVLLLSLILSLT